MCCTNIMQATRSLLHKMKSIPFILYVSVFVCDCIVMFIFYPSNIKYAITYSGFETFRQSTYTGVCFCTCVNTCV